MTNMNQITAKGRDNWRSAKVMDGFRRRYLGMHPLIFQRTIERATSAGEAFDIFEGIPSTFPITWDDHVRKWIAIDDMWLDPGRKAK